MSEAGGIDLGNQTVTLAKPSGISCAKLQGTWLNDGYRGAMGALLPAIDDNTEPANGAKRNFHSLALAFAAITSNPTARVVIVGEATRIEI